MTKSRDRYLKNSQDEPKPYLMHGYCKLEFHIDDYQLFNCLSLALGKFP